MAKDVKIVTFGILFTINALLICHKNVAFLFATIVTNAKIMLDITPQA